MIVQSSPLCARTSSKHSTKAPIAERTFARCSSRSATAIRCPSYPMTPRTLSPSDTAKVARAAARSGATPHRGIPTFTSINTSLIPFSAAIRAVTSESIATVMRELFNKAAIARNRAGSTVSLASNRSDPSPACAMPIISRGVAHVKAVCPTLASSWASAVDLWALICGRKVSPGRTAVMIATLASNFWRSTTSAGVDRLTI